MRAVSITTAILWGTGLPPAAALAAWVFYLKLDPAHLVNALSFRLYCVLFLMLFCWNTARNAFRRPPAVTAVCAGMLLVALQGALWTGYRFSGTAAAGTGEQLGEYYSVDAGDFASPPRLSLTAARVGPKAVVLSGAGVETRLEPGRVRVLEGYGYRLVSVERAPRISVENAQGELVDVVYLKQTSEPGREDYAIIGRLPHRFYVAETAGADGEPAFKLRVVRAKLTIADRMVREGEAVYFDGHYVRCHRGAYWARIAVEKRHSLFLLWAGLFVAGTGLACMIVKKRYADGGAP